MIQYDNFIIEPTIRDHTLNNIFVIFVTLLLFSGFTWLYWRFFYNMFDCKIIDNKLKIVVFDSIHLFEYPITSVISMRRAELFDYLNPFVLRLVTLSLYFRPSIVIKVKKLTFFITPKNLEILGQFSAIKQENNQKS